VYWINVASIKYPCGIPCAAGSDLRLEIETGRSLIIVGANGSGKTRLGVYIERLVKADQVHRIPAQKSLHMNDQISLIGLERAQSTASTSVA
jgi:energy-coupling factor transporter ATP-binding protein EcfA2